MTDDLKVIDPGVIEEAAKVLEKMGYSQLAKKLRAML